jgi:hypothetical protein
VFRLLLEITLTSHAEEPVMLSSSEKQILDHLRSQMTLVKKKAEYKVLRLDGIVFCNQNHWVVWINGISYRPGDIAEFGHILKVESNRVKVYIATINREVTLTLNQEVSLE